MTKTMEGGCLCGSVRYRVSGKPLALTNCHCRSCRRASGAASVAWTSLRDDSLTFLVGTPHAFASSPGVLRTFCGQCGTPLTYRSAERADVVDITTVSLDQPQDCAPTKEIWVEHRIAWEPLNPDLPRYSRSSVGTLPQDD